IHHALNQLAAAKLINGYRGQSAGNMDAVVNTIRILSDLMADQPALHMIEINPLIVTDKAAIIADAVIHRLTA
ncbi:MAG: CoA-binding protein, partial [Alphaproteobacteria bacterium]|nr:CoA-binding protein [Alphaproteobacteria bacterium]